MKFPTLVARNLRFHLRSHLGVLMGIIIGSAALTGALVVGDSVRGTLEENALSRLGPAHFAMFSGHRLFQANLRQRICDGSSGGFASGSARTSRRPSVCPLASALMLPGVVARQDGSARANQVTVIGVEDPAWPVIAHWGTAPGGARTPAYPKLSEDQIYQIFNPIEVLVETSYPNLAESSQRLNADPAIQAWRAGETAFINETLARQLGARTGDEIIVRIRKPSALGMDAAISPKDEGSVSVRLEVGTVLDRQMLGDFALSAGQTPPANLFLPIEALRKQLNLGERANVMMAGPVGSNSVPRSTTWWGKQRAMVAGWLLRWAPKRKMGTQWGGQVLHPDPGSISARTANWIRPKARIDPVATQKGSAVLADNLRSQWLLEDAELSVRAIEQPETATGGEYIPPVIEVSSARIFLEGSVISAALRPRTSLLTNHHHFATDSPSDLKFTQVVTNGVGVLTYLANLIQSETSAAPYSMITATDAPLVPRDMQDDEIIINDWLAEDLKVKPGDSVHLSYFMADSGSRLTERTNTFRVRGIVPIKGRYADRTLMPEFPGIAKAESTHDWDAGFPLTYTIRDKDEAYWKKYRGTPKAFVTLAAGQAMWANRFGALTAIRYEVPANTFPSTWQNAVYRNILANLDPATAGLRFEPVRERALKAANESQDFGQLFLGFSFFLVIAALLLMALLFQFGLEQRAVETGTLLSLGFTPRQVRRLLLLEGAVLTIPGGILGVLAGIAYAKGMLWGLSTIWNRAVANAVLQFYVTPATVLTGFLSSVVVAVLVIWFTLRKQARQPARELLAGQAGGFKLSRRSFGKWIGILATASALAILVWAFGSGQRTNPGAFFGVGCLLLIAGLGFTAAWLKACVSGPPPATLSLAGLGVRSAARRRTRSVATVALLASGCFVISAIGVFRLDTTKGSAKGSGTGGFALIGQSTIPIVQDLNIGRGREAFGLGSNDVAGVTFVQMRVREGEEASCLNLNRAQKPRLLGLNAHSLEGRFTFSAAATGFDPQQGWKLLESREGKNTIPAIGDAASIQWALGKKLGDTLDYTDDQGRPFKIQLVGAVANSMLQGNLLIDEKEFVRLFPGESGYRMFLIDAPSNSVAEVSATLSRALEDVGLELTPAARRLDEFNAVQNTYLNTFQVLGGLGLLLGSAGLGIVVLRNVLERRGELGLLTAVGFGRGRLRQLLLGEHGALLGLGLAIGLVAATAAVLPDLIVPGKQVPLASLAWTLAAIICNGLLWTWLATWYSLRGNLLAALRNE